MTRAQPFHGAGFAGDMFRDSSLTGSVGVTAGELGYRLAPALWGRGPATEACRVAIAHAFASGLVQISAGVWANTLASQHVPAKPGFAMTGDSADTFAARPISSPGLTLSVSR